MSDPIQSLGKQLIKELGLSTSCDTLTRWLVHDVASLMRAAETAAKPDRPTAKEACRAGILDLLSHIHALPPEARHLQSDVAIRNALGRLAPEQVNTSGYFASVGREAKMEGVPEGAASLLNTAEIVDTLSRRIIRTCLRHAARLALDQDTDWVKTMQSIGDYDHGPLRRIKLVAYPADAASQEKVETEIQNRTRERRTSELQDIQTMRKLLDGFETILREEAKDDDDEAAI